MDKLYVKMKYFDYYAYGEVTIVTSHEMKVLFDGNYDLAYWYYPKSELIIVSKEEYEHAAQQSRNL